MSKTKKWRGLSLSKRFFLLEETENINTVPLKWTNRSLKWWNCSLLCGVRKWNGLDFVTLQPNSNNCNAQNTKCRTNLLTSSSTQKLIKSKAYLLTSSSTQKLIYLRTHLLKNSSTQKTHLLKSSSTQKLKLLSFILQNHSNFRAVLAKI